MVYAKHKSYLKFWYTIYIEPTAAYANFKLYAKLMLKQQTLACTRLSSRDKYSNFTYKSVPTSAVSWCMIYMIGKPIKSTFQPNKRSIFWTSH
jgi:hypothetical protein